MRGIAGVAVDDETRKEIFQHEIAEHGEDKHDKIVDAVRRGKVAEYRGNGRENRVERQHEQHGQFEVVRRFERNLSVDRKIPQHRSEQRSKVADPIFDMQNFVE